MKKAILVGLFSLMASPLFAGVGDYADKQPQPNSYVSEGVYNSSNTAIVSTYTIVCDKAAILHSVIINTPGATGAKLQIFSSNTSTFGVTAVKIATIDTTSKETLLYDVYTATGITINNTGNPPADVTVTFRKK